MLPRPFTSDPVAVAVAVALQVLRALHIVMATLAFSQLAVSAGICLNGARFSEPRQPDDQLRAPVYQQAELLLSEPEHCSLYTARMIDVGAYLGTKYPSPMSTLEVMALLMPGSNG
ncbi:hypothetical protein P3T76_013085 [Phytophthora citrophthora]|uniref:Uncharacterized protein n=1 Tax=Phytophthora citrophthora TaxID=4793 RepID=A0AAD9LDJ6_9STRA|nr:hypothetical protein P3T76_013085 [Phytophthora citrophthora]